MGHRKQKVANGAAKGAAARGKKTTFTAKEDSPSSPTSFKFQRKFFLLGLLAGILVPCLPSIWQVVQSALEKSSIFKADEATPEYLTPRLPEYERVSLFEPYALDFAEVLRVREANMKKYSYPYKENGVDKRSKMSLQEYWDVYDGKW